MLRGKKGAYLLVVELEGELERWGLKGGIYAYVGSAWGPGGLLARVKRHLTKSFERPKWHVDYLTSKGRPLAAFLFPCVKEEELYELVSKHFKPAAEGFGSTDTKHKTHLFVFERSELPRLLAAARSLRKTSQTSRHECT